MDENNPVFGMGGGVFYVLQLQRGDDVKAPDDSTSLFFLRFAVPYYFTEDVLELLLGA